jgi:glycosyltransferase involved in cell wall biosynthesis
METFFERAGIPYEFVVVDDGSTDATLKFFQGKAIVNPYFRYLTHTPNRGRGVSIREGVLAAKGDFILETDADGSVDNEAITRFLNYFQANPDVDALFGSRQLPESRIAYNQPTLRVVLGYGFIYLARILFRMWGGEFSS